MNRYKVENFLVGSNKDEVLKVIDKLVKENVNICITGQMSVGKTTLMKSLLNNVDRANVIELIQSSDYEELASHYPERDIIVNRNIKKEKDLGIFYDRFDRVTVLLDEVHNKDVLQYYLKQSVVSGTNCLLTHYAKDSRSLISSLTDDVVKYGLIKEKSIAKRIVLDNLNVDINLAKSPDGVIYLNRISVITPVSNDSIDFTVMDVVQYYAGENKYNISAIGIN